VILRVTTCGHVTTYGRDSPRGYRLDEPESALSFKFAGRLDSQTLSAMRVIQFGPAIAPAT
jgi:hypothetical protein